MDLFDQQVIPVSLGSEEASGEIIFWPNWLSGPEADQLLQIAIDRTPWRHDSIKIVGKTIPIPRLQNWFGDPETSYTYSGIRLQAIAFPDWMDNLRAQLSSTQISLLIARWLTITDMVKTALTGMLTMRWSWARHRSSPP